MYTFRRRKFLKTKSMSRIKLVIWALPVLALSKNHNQENDYIVGARRLYTRSKERDRYVRVPKSLVGNQAGSLKPEDTNYN